MIIIRLREAMLKYHRKTGKKYTYKTLAADTGYSITLFSKIGRGAPDCNPTLEVINAICGVLKTNTDELLVYQPDAPASKGVDAIIER